MNLITEIETKFGGIDCSGYNILVRYITDEKISNCEELVKLSTNELEKIIIQENIDKKISDIQHINALPESDKKSVKRLVKMIQFMIMKKGV